MTAGKYSATETSGQPLGLKQRQKRQMMEEAGPVMRAQSFLSIIETVKSAAGIHTATTHATSKAEEVEDGIYQKSL
jgi:hypothetical protein